MQTASHHGTRPDPLSGLRPSGQPQSAFSDRMVVLVPGQGAYAADWASGQQGLVAVVAELASTIDPIAVGYGCAPVSSILLADAPPSLSHLLAVQPDELQFAVYTLSVASGRLLLGAQTPDLLLGHSFGEIAALQLAGAFDVATGARLVGERVSALRAEAPSGTGMLAISATEEWVRAAVGVARSGVELAVRNGELQQVVSGPTADLTRFAALAAAADVSVTPLASPYGFHHSTLAGARTRFARALRALPIGAARLPVYSPILRRRYRAGDDLAALLALHLITPVDFAGTVRDLLQEGYRSFVEVSASTALVGLIRRADPAAYAVSLVAGDPGASTERVISDLTWAADRLANGSGPGQVVMKPVAEDGASLGILAEPGAGVPAVSGAPGLDRAGVSARVAEIYAAALEYPVEVFTDEVELEADLGVDSVKQTELIGRLREEFAMPAPPEDFRMSSVARFGQVLDLVLASAHPRTATVPTQPTSPAGPGDLAIVLPDTVAAATGAPAVSGAPGLDRAGVSARVAEIYAAALEYPVEVFTDEVELEADLGVDSVKQTELIGRLREEFAMPAPPEDFRMSSVARFGQVLDLVLASAPAGTGHVTVGV